jgi:hypothetical protein
MNRRMRLLLMGGKGVPPTPPTPTQALLAKFVGTGDEVGVTYYVNSGTPYIFTYRHVTDRMYERHTFAFGTIAIGQLTVGIFTDELVDLYRGFTPSTTPACVPTPNSWNVNTSMIGGGYYYFVNGRYVELVSNNDIQWVGAVFVQLNTRGGILLCTIDGDNTLADLLPTAQNLVDSGALLSTVLVANGGLLNPTDRIVDTYNLTANCNSAYNNSAYILFTKSLSKGQHTIRLTAVGGYRNVNATSTEMTQMNTMITGGPGTAGMSGVAWPVFITRQGCGANMTDEISYAFLPVGATNWGWLGHSGQSVFSALPAITVDGVATDIIGNPKTIYIGSQNVTITLLNNIRHPDLGATNLGTYNVTYTFDRVTDLTISHSVTWATTGSVDGYPGMMSCAHVDFNRFNTIGNTAKDLTHNDDSINLDSTGQVAFMWKDTGYVAKILYIPDLLKTVNNWAGCSSTQHGWWADWSTGGGSVKKFYVTRFRTDAPRAFANAENWQSEINYRVQWFPGGANAAMTS